MPLTVATGAASCRYDCATYDSQNDVTTIANHRVYDAYGNLQSETSSAVDCLFGYTGRLFDEATGLQNNLNRWYDATTGRWISQDPIGFGGRDANLYRYCSNRSMTSADPTGLQSAVAGSGVIPSVEPPIFPPAGSYSPFDPPSEWQDPPVIVPNWDGFGSGGSIIMPPGSTDIYYQWITPIPPILIPDNSFSVPRLCPFKKPEWYDKFIPVSPWLHIPEYQGPQKPFIDKGWQGVNPTPPGLLPYDRPFVIPGFPGHGDLHMKIGPGAGGGGFEFSR